MELPCAVIMSTAFESLRKLWQVILDFGGAALVFGGIFGFLLQRARIVRFDFTLLKYMLSAVIVGAVVIYALAAIDYIELPWRPVVLCRIFVGGLLFGLGWAILGYCPGTQLGALGEGRYDALAGILGAVLGTWLFMIKLNPWLSPLIMKRWDVGKAPLDAMLGVNPWVLIGVMIAVCIPLFIWLERKRL
jgi:hypothetical protein